MSPALYRRVRYLRALQKARYALLSAFRTLTFPVRHPHYWLFARYIGIFWDLWHNVDEAKAIRFARVWPRQLPYIIELLNSRGDRRWGVVL